MVKRRERRKGVVWVSPERTGKDRHNLDTAMKDGSGIDMKITHGSGAYGLKE
jgi:hypothetical protein